MSVLLRAVAAVTLAATTAIPAPAHAAHVCLENNQLSFSPPLSLFNQGGTVTITWQGTCADLPGLTPRQYSGAATVPYFGSCAVAFIAEGAQSQLVAGTLYFFVRGGVEVKVEVMQPNDACPISSAHGSGVLVGVP